MNPANDADETYFLETRSSADADKLARRV